MRHARANQSHRARPAKRTRAAFLRDSVYVVSVKRFVNKEKEGFLHQIKLSESSTTGQTKVFGMSAYLDEFKAGLP